MNQPMMKCGHAANATSEGKPSCAICSCKEVTETPSLDGRIAKCGMCGAEKPSKQDKYQLAFFEYKGPVSRHASDICGNCGYAKNAHKPEVMARNSALKCKSFEANGGAEYDSYYCGCRGWD